MITIEIDKMSAQEQAEALARLLVENPDTRKRLKESVKIVLKRARKDISQDVRGYLYNDPRSAYRAVKHAIYRQILGGNISILASRRAGTKYKLIVKRKLDENPNQRGGNRRKRSDRTEQIDTYFGKDRGFILRFLNAGTDERLTRFGKRGSIRPRRLFEVPAAYHIEEAVETLANSFTTELIAAYEDK